MNLHKPSINGELPNPERTTNSTIVEQVEEASYHLAQQKQVERAKQAKRAKHVERVKQAERAKQVERANRLREQSRLRKIRQKQQG